MSHSYAINALISAKFILARIIFQLSLIVNCMHGRRT